MTIDEAERLRRWRLALGGDAQHSLGVGLAGDDVGMDEVLTALYDEERSIGMGSSAPRVTRWLGDIRTYFPSSTVRVMQQDALERLGRVSTTVMVPSGGWPRMKARCWMGSTAMLHGVGPAGTVPVSGVAVTVG